VWPLFTGWASLAEYRTGRPLSAYAHLMQNANMTWTQDLGAVTELLSGQYFAPFGRSTTHQLWSSAMVLTPAIRGLFGVSVDGNVITVDPHLPADWESATLRHVPVSGGTVDLAFRRSGESLVVEASGPHAASVMLASSNSAKTGTKSRGGRLVVALPAAEIVIPHELPLPGARTTQLKVLEQRADPGSTTWLLEAQGGSTYRLPLRLNRAQALHIEGGTLAPEPEPKGETKPGPKGAPATGMPRALQTLIVHFPAGAGYTQQRVTLQGAPARGER
jgi:hypothetical protein